MYFKHSQKVTTSKDQLKDEWAGKFDTTQECLYFKNVICYVFRQVNRDFLGCL